jgi:hypothetical protein
MMFHLGLLLFSGAAVLFLLWFLVGVARDLKRQRLRRSMAAVVPILPRMNHNSDADKIARGAA